MPISDYPPYRLANLPRTLETRVPVKALRDRLNRLRFGADGPRSDEPLFVDPAALTLGYRPDPGHGAPAFRRGDSGRVVGGDWDRSVAPLGDTVKAAAIRRHFLDGVPWEDTGIFEATMAHIARKGQSDGLRSLDDVRARYAAVDALHDEVRQTGRLRLRCELPGWFRREHGGILAHVARDGRVLKAGGGVHRLTIAQILGLPEVPVQVGVVHPGAVAAGHLARLRRSRLGVPERAIA
jgi:hypothetical protein